jgi:2-keto-3-deoxy-L-rhamnonate aldolase RhmA
MLKNPLLEKIKQNKPALGCHTGDPHLVELLAQLGMDWFYIDHMFADNDWSKTQTLLWAGEAAGITPVIRIQAHPWLGYDHRVAVDVSRAQGIGAQFMLVSHSGDQEIREALSVAKDWHRRAMTVHAFKSLDWAGTIDQMTDQAYIIPHAETTGALESIEQTMSLPDLKMFFIGMTDASLVITGEKNPDFKNPKLWAYIKKVVEIAEKRGIYIGANTSYAYTLNGMRERVKMLVDAGLKFIMMQTAPFLFQVAMTELLDGVRSDLKL